MSTKRLATLVVALAVGQLVGCGSDSGNGDESSAASTPVIDPGDGGDYHPNLDPADFVTGVDNPYFPLRPGSRWTYTVHTKDETEHNTVIVTGRTKRVVGIDAVVVHDTVAVEGEIAEDTFDWYAQDRDGNVWYLGENTHEYENGQPVSSEGSWQAGVDGALPGILMPAQPRVGMAYRQEYYPGEAEDMGQILRLGGKISVPAGSYADLVVTRDWTPLEPDIVEQKTYAKGVGVVAEDSTDERVELVAYRAG